MPQSIIAEVRSADAQVCARIHGRDVTRAELSAAFDRVANPTHWKLPIDAVVDVVGDFDLEVLREAVVFYTGSRPTFEPKAGATLPGCRYRVTAAGYYRRSQRRRHGVRWTAGLGAEVGYAIHCESTARDMGARLPRAE